MMGINHKALVLKKLEELLRVAPDLTFSEIIYTAYRKKFLPQVPDRLNLKAILEVKDEDLYKAIILAIKNERNG